ncbi:uncharacterized protein LOC131153587 isoform X2 [Malania oleifera]|uniref:uncharacterized protein LOC131153587 isoform X2 n=1 Tax=Malania oleifera TaxID=397392 RepID=UPI0025AE8164|nr:uncharacterized protein LOC131153587 isoform X2 [Malania oleifera]
MSSEPSFNHTQNKFPFVWPRFGLYSCSKEMEKEAKKENFRKYLESSGVLDALTKVFVALYEQNDKPSSAIEFIQQKLGGPTVSEYEKLQAELSDLQMKYNDLVVMHQKTCTELEELKNSHSVPSSKEPVDEETSSDGQ